MRKIANDLCCTLGNYSFPYPFTPSVRDGNNIRPVPMQTLEVPPETVEGVMNLDNRTATAAANAENLAGAVRDVIQTIRVGDRQNNK